MPRKPERKKPTWRKTAIRTALLAVLAAHPRPITVAQIKEKLSERKLRPNKTTLYRDLELFLKKGLIAPINFNDGKTRFELTARGHHHHLICKSCKKIEDVILEIDLASEEEEMKRRKNFGAITHSLEFYGICKTCQNKA